MGLCQLEKGEGEGMHKGMLGGGHDWSEYGLCRKEEAGKVRLMEA